MILLLKSPVSFPSSNTLPCKATRKLSSVPLFLLGLVTPKAVGNSAPRNHKSGVWVRGGSGEGSVGCVAWSWGRSCSYPHCTAFSHDRGVAASPFIQANSRAGGERGGARRPQCSTPVFKVSTASSHLTPFPAGTNRGWGSRIELNVLSTANSWNLTWFSKL